MRGCYSEATILLTGLSIMFNLHVHCLSVSICNSAGGVWIPDTQRKAGINSASILGCSLRPYGEDQRLALC